MSADSTNNENTINDGPVVAERLRAARERIARRLDRPVLIPPELALPSLDALKEAARVAAHLADGIGAVNPRPPGLFNELVQTVKRAIARALGWIVRPQRDFNRAVLESLARSAELLEATNRTTNTNLIALAEAFARSREIHRATGKEIEALRDEFDERMKLQRWAYDGALGRQSTALQDRMYDLLGDELRVLRQRVAALGRSEMAPAAVSASSASAPSAAAAPLGIDYYQIERHFRGTEEEIRARQSFYIPFFAGRKNVLDIACGRGEFLELMREANVSVKGVDLDADMVGRCLEKDLNVTRADVFAYLAGIADSSLDGIFCSQFVEHLTPDAYIRLLSECGKKLAPGGVLAVETQNPECLAIFSQSFYIDPTHVKPIPAALLRVLFREAGLGKVSTHFLSPASAGLPLIPQLASQTIEPEALEAWNKAVARFNETFFGGMDYAVIGYRVEPLPAGSKSSS
jgi:2-polyprenyl-3-methyl-5-hydroxy-6-metoxy-1,4-benzoquinol methylase